MDIIHFNKADEGVSLINDVTKADQKTELEGGLNVVTTCVFIVGVIAGSGFLTLPKAIDDSGWIGFLLVTLCCFVSAYTGDILGKCWTIVRERHPEFKNGKVRYPYPAIGEEAYGRWGRRIISFSINFTMFGATIVYILLAAENIVKLLPSDSKFTCCYISLIIWGVMTPFTWFGTPKDFWFCDAETIEDISRTIDQSSKSGHNVSHIVGGPEPFPFFDWKTFFAAYFKPLKNISKYHMFRGIAAAATIATSTASFILLGAVIHYSSDINIVEVTHTKVDVISFFTAYGTICFAYNGHPAFPTFQSDMKNPKKFGRALVLGYLIVLIVYMPCSIATYVVYGVKIEANILSTVPSGASTTIVSLLMTAHLLFAIVIVINPVAQELEHVLNVPEHFTWKRIVSRTLTMAAVLLIVESVPHFSSILSLVGGSTISILAFLCPPLFYIKLCKGSDVHTEIYVPLHKKVLLYEIMFIGVTAGAAATYSAITDLAVNKFTVPCYVNIYKACPRQT